MSSDVIRNLPTLVDEQRTYRDNAKGPTRLESKVAEKKLTTVTERDFKKAVWARDGSRCRCCGRKVIKTLGRVPERGEVHHLHQRIGWLKFEERAAILVCCACHEQLTGRVNERLSVEPKEKDGWFRQGHDGRRYIDARKPLRFVRVA